MIRQEKPRRDVGTLEEMRERCWKWIEMPDGRRVLSGSPYSRHIVRPISLRVSRIAIRLGISANAASLMMILAGISGIVFAIPHVVWCTVIAAIAFFLFDLLDSVDGEVARWTGVSSTRGLFLDKVAHLLIEHPSLGMPALHYYAVTGSDRYLMLGAVAIISSVTARAARETFLRINAENSVPIDRGSAEQLEAAGVPPKRSWFLVLCERLKWSPLLAFPFAKSRVVHIATIVAIAVSYGGHSGGLVALAWFFAVYAVARMAIELPYFYFRRVVDVPHVRRPGRYRWPL